MKKIINAAKQFILLIPAISFLCLYSCDGTGSDSGRVWCENCMTWHDKETAEAELKERPIWCVNCQKFHAPGEDG
tara:strand:- start:1141 stop:1365 length:225 start_codon:yes stop_codon:yes gene_type:complete